MYISIEGVIGAGKSTLLNRLKFDNFKVVYEPFEKYSQFQSYNPLLEAATIPEENAATTQLHVIRTGCQHYSDSLQNTSIREVVLSERSSLSSIAFTRAHERLGNLSNYTADYLESFAKETCKKPPKLIIYLDIDPKLATARAKPRKRIHERHLSVEFQETLHKCYLEMLENLKIPFVLLPVHFEDSATDVYENLLKLIE